MYVTDTSVAAAATGAAVNRIHGHLVQAPKSIYVVDIALHDSYCGQISYYACQLQSRSESFKAESWGRICRPSMGSGACLRKSFEM